MPSSTARSRASPPPRARCSRCCRPTTPPATSPRSCSGFPCASASRRTWRARARSGPACRCRRASIQGPAAALPRRSPSRPCRRQSRPMATAASRASSVPLRAASAPADHIDPRRLVAFLAMVFGMFMAILDIQIVSASLTEIQAGLAASANEITLVQTAYLISEVVMIPLSGYLSRAMGTRLLFAISAGGFTAASLMCGLSTSINEMIVWRLVQGFIGGAMIPTLFATSFMIFPRSRMGLITPLIGLVATLAPTIGHTVGGYLTDTLSWHWLFFINIVPGIAVTLVTFALIDFDRPDFTLFEHFDWQGLVFMAGFLGA